MRDAGHVRTTLDLDDDVLQAAKEIAETRHMTAGQVVSDLVRKALHPPARPPRVRNGVSVLPRRPDGAPLTMKRVNELRD